VGGTWYGSGGGRAAEIGTGPVGLDKSDMAKPVSRSGVSGCDCAVCHGGSAEAMNKLDIRSSTSIVERVA